MSNSSVQLNIHSRAMIAGALVGAVASGVENWRRHQNGELNVQQTACRVVTDAAKAGALSGVAMYVANASAGRPVLALTTTLAAVAAGVYLLDSIQGEQSHGNK